jgi:hypothetical protein
MGVPYPHRYPKFTKPDPGTRIIWSGLSKTEKRMVGYWPFSIKAPASRDPQVHSPIDALVWRPAISEGQEPAMFRVRITKL